MENMHIYNLYSIGRDYMNISLQAVNRKPPIPHIERTSAPMGAANKALKICSLS